MLIRVQSLTAKLLFGVKVISKTELSIVLRPNNGMSPENVDVSRKRYFIKNEFPKIIGFSETSFLGDTIFRRHHFSETLDRFTCFIHETSHRP